MKGLAAKILLSCSMAVGSMATGSLTAYSTEAVDLSKPAGSARVGGKTVEWRRVPTPASPDIERADKLLREGQAEEAESIIRGLLSARERELGEKSPELIVLLRGLGTACWTQGKSQEAQVVMKRAIDLQLAAKSGPTEDLAYDMRVLGQSYLQDSRKSDAQSILALGLHTIDQANKDDSQPCKVRLELLDLLAQTMQQDGDWARAEPLLERLYKLQTQHQEVLKVTDNARLDTLRRLATVKSMQGDHPGAKKSLQDALDLSLKQKSKAAE